jgi:hypothetical protein
MDTAALIDEWQYLLQAYERDRPPDLARWSAESQVVSQLARILLGPEQDGEARGVNAVETFEIDDRLPRAARCNPAKELCFEFSGARCVEVTVQR